MFINDILSVIESKHAGMEVFLKEVSFHGIMLDELFSASPEFKKNLHDIMTEGIAAGFIQPLSRTVFPSTSVEQAFRYDCGGDQLWRIKHIHIKTYMKLVNSHCILPLRPSLFEITQYISFYLNVKTAGLGLTSNLNVIV